jgi:hypothetical protein
MGTPAPGGGMSAIPLTDAVLRRVAEEAKYLANLSDYEAVAWAVTDPQGRYLETWGRTDFSRGDVQILTDELLESVRESNGGRPGGGVFVVHNHPSQSGQVALPSRADLPSIASLERKLANAGAHLLDFAIVVHRGWPWSYRDSLADGSFARLKAAIMPDQRRVACSNR